MRENICFEADNNTVKKEKTVLFNGKKIKEHYEKPTQSNAEGKYKIEVFKPNGKVDVVEAENAFTDRFNLLPHTMFEHIVGIGNNPFGREGFKWDMGLLFTTGKAVKEYPQGNIPDGKINAIAGGKVVFSDIAHNRGGTLNTELSFFKRYSSFSRLNLVYDFTQECGNGIHKGIYYATGNGADWAKDRINSLLGSAPESATEWNLYQNKIYDITFSEDYDVIEQVIEQTQSEYQPVFKTLGKYEDYEYIGQPALPSKAYSTKYYYAKRDIDTNELVFVELGGLEADSLEKPDNNLFLACDTKKNIYWFKTIETNSLTVSKGTVNYTGGEANAVEASKITYTFPDDSRKMYMKVFDTYTIFIGVPKGTTGYTNQLFIYRFANGETTPADTWTINVPNEYSAKFASKTLSSMILNNELYVFAGKQTSPSGCSGTTAYGYKLVRDYPETIALDSNILKFDHITGTGKSLQDVFLDQIEENVPIVTRGTYIANSSYKRDNVTSAFQLFMPISYTNLDSGFIEKTTSDTMRITYTLTIHHNFMNYLTERRKEVSAK